MEILIPPPREILGFLIALPALAGFLGLFWRGKPLLQRLAPMLLVGTACGLFHHFGVSEMRFRWDAAGLLDQGFQEPQQLVWSEVLEARRVDSSHGPWPERRTNGVYFDGNSGGTWRLADGRSARVFIEAGATQALLLETQDGLFFYAPVAFEDFLRTAERGIPSGVGP